MRRDPERGGELMQRTRSWDLLIAFVLVGAVGYGLLRVYYGQLPPLEYSLAVPLAVLAVIELVIARRVRMAIRHVRDAKAMTAIAIARSVALGKASALVGSALAGLAAALLIRVAPDLGVLRVAGNDLGVGIGVLIASGLLVAAGLVLERAGIDPGAGRRDPAADRYSPR